MPTETDPKWRSVWITAHKLAEIAVEMAATQITDEAERRGFQKAVEAMNKMREPPRFTR